MTQCGVNRSADELDRRRSTVFRSCARSSTTTCGSPASGAELNQELEKAGRVSDFIDLAELMCIDALDRDESCGRPLPRRAPNTRRRGATRRRELLLRVGVGTPDPARTLHPPPRAADLHRRATRAEGLQDQMKITLKIWRQPSADTRRRIRDAPRRRRQAGDDHPRAARPPQRQPGDAGKRADSVRIRLPRRHLLAPAASPSTDAHTGRCPTPRRADSTCGTSKTVPTVRLEPFRSAAYPVVARPDRRPLRTGPRSSRPAASCLVDAGTAPDADTVQIR